MAKIKINGIKVKQGEETTQEALLDYQTIGITTDRTLKQGLVGDSNNKEQEYLIDNSLVDKIGTGGGGTSTAPLDKGQAENSIQSKNSLAISEDAIALGKDNVAGCYAFKIEFDRTTDVFTKFNEDTKKTDAYLRRCCIVDFDQSSSGSLTALTSLLDDYLNTQNIIPYYCLAVTARKFIDDAQSEQEVNNLGYDYYNFPFEYTVINNKIEIIFTDENQLVKLVDYTEYPLKIETESSEQLPFLTNEEIDNYNKDKAEIKQVGYNIIRFPFHPQYGTLDIGHSAYAEGSNNLSGPSSHTEGNGNLAAGRWAHAEGIGNIATYASHAEGKFNKALALFSHAEGLYTEANGNAAHAEGYNTLATAARAHAEGNITIASGAYSHAQNTRTVASGEGSTAIGGSTKAIGRYSTAEGIYSEANSDYSHAEGNKTLTKILNGTDSGAEHAEGYKTTAQGRGAHAEGLESVAQGRGAHAEGQYTLATGENGAHAEGRYTVASGAASHASGLRTKAVGNCQTVVGQDNAEDTNALFIVGGGAGSGKVTSTPYNLLTVSKQNMVINTPLTVNDKIKAKSIELEEKAALWTYTTTEAYQIGQNYSSYDFYPNSGKPFFVEVISPAYKNFQTVTRSDDEGTMKVDLQASFALSANNKLWKNCGLFFPKSEIKVSFLDYDEMQSEYDELRGQFRIWTYNNLLKSVWDFYNNSSAFALDFYFRFVILN